MSEPFMILDGVAIAFGKTLVFQDVSLTLSRGCVAVIAGDSGVGKSTLLRALAGQCQYTGTIRIDGQNVGCRLKEAQHCRIVLVPQRAFLWDHLTAGENVALVRRLVHGDARTCAKDASLRILKALEVDDVANRYPFRLSGGEQQRVSLARGLAADADIYLLDEVTAYLDPRRREQIGLLFRRLAKDGKTLVIATHDRQFALQMSDHPLELTQNGLRPLERAEKQR